MSADQERHEEEQPRMTIRVYTATRDGRVTEDRGTVHVMVGEKTGIDTLGSVFPPCQCPRHRERTAPEQQ